MTCLQHLSLRAIFLLIAVLSSRVIPCSSQEPQEMLVESVRADDPVAIEKAVVELGADINLQGAGGQTPLVSAVLSGKLQAVEILLKLGADVTIPEKDGYTVMHAAGFQGRASILKALAEYKDGIINPLEMHQDGYYPLHRACWGREHRHAKTVQVFLNMGVPPDLESADGKTCLTMTTNPKTKSLIKTALEKMSSAEL